MACYRARVNDVVLAALIAGVVGLLGTGATLLVTRWNLTDQATQRQNARMDAFLQSRREQYGELLWLLNRLKKYGELGYPPTQTDWSDWLDQYSYHSSLVSLLGSAAVADGVETFTAALHDAAQDLGDVLLPQGGDGIADGWAEAYRTHQEALEVARDRLILRMRQDLVLIG